MKPDLVYSLFPLFFLMFVTVPVEKRENISEDIQMPLLLWEYDGWDIITICFSKFIWTNMEGFESSETS